MSRKTQKYKRQKKKNFPRFVLALGGLLIAAAVFLFARSGDGGGTPSIVVDQQRIDYGDVKFGDNKTFVIQVTNTGGGTLRFKEEPYIEIVEDADRRN